MSSHKDYMSARAYQEMLLAEAKKVHSPNAAGRVDPQLERLLVHVGDVLISAGLRLRERYEPAICNAPETYRSAAGPASV